MSKSLSIHEILTKVTPTPVVNSSLSDSDKVTKVTALMTEVLETLGLDLKNDSMADTPKRIAKMYVNEIFPGLKEEAFPKITVIENQMKYDQMVLVKDIRVMSICEHHFMPIHGTARVAYIPNRKVIGLSKINRIVDYFCRRPQVQERLTKQIADCLQMILETEHVAVHIEAKHYCVIARGIEDDCSATITSDLRGHFKSIPETRAEFLASAYNRGG